MGEVIGYFRTVVCRGVECQEITEKSKTMPLTLTLSPSTKTVAGERGKDNGQKRWWKSAHYSANGFPIGGARTRGSVNYLSNTLLIILSDTLHG